MLFRECQEKHLSSFKKKDLSVAPIVKDSLLRLMMKRTKFFMRLPSLDFMAMQEATPSRSIPIYLKNVKSDKCYLNLMSPAYRGWNAKLSGEMLFIPWSVNGMKRPFKSRNCFISDACFDVHIRLRELLQKLPSAQNLFLRLASHLTF